MKDFSLDFNFASGKPEASALFRSQPEDFQVEEDLGFLPSGEGEHLYVHIRKRNQNTIWVASQLARACGVRKMDVGYCGLKDRHAVTSQWFSIYLPKSVGPDWAAFHVDGVELLTVSRHGKKLKPGSHRANQFTIRLRELRSDVGERLAAAAAGVPNYFGEQRFGIAGGNLQRAEGLLSGAEKIKDRKQRGLMISAARAYLFNRVLSERVKLGNWRELLRGEPGSVATGPLWGRGRPLVRDECAALEAEVLAPWQDWCNGLEHVGLQQERRELLCLPLEFTAGIQGEDLVLGFQLAPGQYATAVLREIAELRTFPKAG